MDSPLAPGTKLGRYEIRSKIGEGGMGEVYLAQDTKLDRKVALKILPVEVAAHPDRMKRFVQEAKTASALNHPNIITIYEIEQSDAVNFIATEFVDGETLREWTQPSGVKVSEVLEVATQIASALAAAHAAGIVHRDIKPENIMLRRDGIVKVLDFGLAKLTERPPRDSVDAEAPTRAVVNTDPGVVMGTALYMSPEQARGMPIDARTDIFSLAIVLYEMVAGCLPFEGATASDVMASILSDKEPPPLARYAREVPAEMERIISKGLRKNRDERYQTTKDLLIDLKDLQRELLLQAQLERRASSELPPRTTSSADESAMSATAAPVQAASTGADSAAPTTSSGTILLGEIKRHRVGVALTLAVLVIAAVALFFFYFHRQPALSDKDTILLADWVNTTGDAVFDGTLKQALAVQLEQSPFLNIFSEERARETLRLMSRSADERVTREVAREICQRQGLKALLTGSITSLGRNYVITLEAINSQTGEVIARQQVEAGSKEQVIKKLGEAATKLREKLGESLASIKKFDAPIEEATTSSLEALKAFSLGRELFRQGKTQESIPPLKRAVELDPNFALAYYLLGIVYGGQRELSEAATQRAFELRNRVSERERLLISSTYYGGVTGELEKAIEALELVKQTYPRDVAARILLGFRYSDTGQYEKAIAEHREALRLNPNIANQYAGLATAFIHLNRFDEAKDICEQALRQKMDIPPYHNFLYVIAFVQGDTSGMQKQVDWASQRPDEFIHLNWQAEAAAFSGQWRKSQAFSAQSVDMSQRRNLKESAANVALVRAMTNALFGNCQSVKTDVASSLALARPFYSLSSGARALALCGEVGEAESLADEIARRFPKHTLANAVFLPMIRAAIETRRGNAAQAIQLLQGASRFEMGTSVSLWPAYLRGLAYLHQGAGREAMTEFQKILDHRGVVAISTLYPLAQLGLARAAALTGDTATARKSYQDFLALWKDADADIPILIEAKKEYEKLK